MIEDVQVQGMASHDLQLPSTIRPPKADELHGFPQAPISAQGGLRVDRVKLDPQLFQKCAAELLYFLIM